MGAGGERDMTSSLMLAHPDWTTKWHAARLFIRTREYLEACRVVDSELIATHAHIVCGLEIAW